MQLAPRQPGAHTSCSSNYTCLRTGPKQYVVCYCCCVLPVSCVAVWPAIRTRLFSSFPTRTDLINAMMASCHLPTLSDGSFTVNFNGRLHIDGGLLSVLTPPPGAAHTVHVCR
eukprot:GHUV01034536.1.p1 GENE.GHUV01034536.1~~GHUV01034536.1.p1  ORF type:complete len:113 (+),score=22.76 GHUV01034536.1:208-546(+)